MVKASGILVDEEEAKDLVGWLNDYAEMMYYNGHSNCISHKEDLAIARKVSEFLGKLRTLKGQ